MIMTVLIGVGSGYFLWGSRVARLTEALSTLTLEQDTLRERLAAPRGEQPQPAEGTVRATEELHAINEAITGVRNELSQQKALVEKCQTIATAPDVEAATVELRKLRTELTACIADKQDLEVRCSGAAAPTPPAAPAAPTYFPR